MAILSRLALTLASVLFLVGPAAADGGGGGHDLKIQVEPYAEDEKQPTAVEFTGLGGASSLWGKATLIDVGSVYYTPEPTALETYNYDPPLELTPATEVGTIYQWGEGIFVDFHRRPAPNGASQFTMEQSDSLWKDVKIGLDFKLSSELDLNLHYLDATYEGDEEEFVEIDEICLTGDGKVGVCYGGDFGRRDAPPLAPLSQTEGIKNDAIGTVYYDPNYDDETLILQLQIKHVF